MSISILINRVIAVSAIKTAWRAIFLLLAVKVKHLAARLTLDRADQCFELAYF